MMIDYSYDNISPKIYPRIRDLPEDEKEPFKEFLRGQTCPMIPKVPMGQQDGFYPWDYENWKCKVAGKLYYWD